MAVVAIELVHLARSCNRASRRNYSSVPIEGAHCMRLSGKIFVGQLRMLRSLKAQLCKLPGRFPGTLWGMRLSGKASHLRYLLGRFSAFGKASAFQTTSAICFLVNGFEHRWQPSS